jgi:hypothetical protein
MKKEVGVCHAHWHGRKNSCRIGGWGMGKVSSFNTEKAAIIGCYVPDRKKTRKFDKIGKILLTVLSVYGKNRKDGLLRLTTLSVLSRISYPRFLGKGLMRGQVWNKAGIRRCGKR